jgi:hypothetical protein
MDFLLGGGQIVVGLGALVLWWITLTLVGRRWSERSLGTMRFAVTPCVFLLWFVFGFLITLRGLGLF